MTNDEVIDAALKELPPEFFGSVELQFHRGVITHTKTVHTRKFNTTQAASPEGNNERPVSRK